MPSLVATNKHLRTVGRRKEAVRLTVATSSAIEGISAPFKVKAGTAREVAKSTKKAVEPARVKASRPVKTD